jgi:hypothetical protein
MQPRSRQQQSEGEKQDAFHGKTFREDVWNEEV